MRMQRVYWITLSSQIIGSSSFSAHFCSAANLATPSSLQLCARESAGKRGWKRTHGAQ
jgi:hypothetical protein